jgi:uncharacterized protein (TIGR02452 family)
MIVFYDNEYSFDIPNPIYKTKFIIVDKDTFSAASAYNNPCCLNFASHKRAGGGYLKPWVKAQEEDLFRRSNLPGLMDTEKVRKFYPLSYRQGFFTDDVHVIKDEYLNGINHFDVSVITLPALVNPTSNQTPITSEKIERILNIAHKHKQKTIILGAWGCGVFKNDPKLISKIMYSFLNGKFSGVFETVVFAIPNKNSENFTAFENVFK